MRPKERVGAVPEVVSEVVGIGGYHSFDAGVDDGEGIIGPEIPANVGEVLVFEEQTITQVAIENKLGL